MSLDEYNQFIKRQSPVKPTSGSSLGFVPPPIYTQLPATTSQTPSPLSSQVPASSVFHSHSIFTPPLITQNDLLGLLRSPSFTTVDSMQFQALQAEMADMRKLLTGAPSSFPPYLHKSIDLDERELFPRDKPLTQVDLQHVFNGFTAASLSDQKFTLPEFSGESNGDA